MCVQILSWQRLPSLYLCVVLTPDTENCNFYFPILRGRFLYVPPTGANRSLVNNKKTSDLGMFHTASALEDELFHFAYFVSTMEPAGIMDFYKGLWSNWQLSGLKGCFWVAVKGFRCETLVFKSPEQNVWLLSAPPLSFQRKGETLGEARTLKSNLLFSIWMPGAFFPPQSLCGWWGGQIEMAQTAPCTMADQERGRENEARENGRLNEGKPAWLLIVGKCGPGVKRVHGLL